MLYSVCGDVAQKLAFLSQPFPKKGMAGTLPSW